MRQATSDLSAGPPIEFTDARQVAMAFGFLAIPARLGRKAAPTDPRSHPMRRTSRPKVSRPLMAGIVVGAFMPNDELRKSRDIDRRFRALQRTPTRPYLHPLKATERSGALHRTTASTRSSPSCYSAWRGRAACSDLTALVAATLAAQTLVSGHASIARL